MAEGEELGLIEDGSGAEESGGEETFAETETETEEGPGAESETPGEEGGPGGEEPPPSRALPTELRKAFREFIAGNPEFAKRFPRLERQLTDAMFKTSELGKLGGLQQLRSAAVILEHLGGAAQLRCSRITAGPKASARLRLLRPFRECLRARRDS